MRRLRLNQGGVHVEEHSRLDLQSEWRCDNRLRGDLDQREWEQPRRVNTRRRGLAQACTGQAIQRLGHRRLRTQCRLGRGEVGVAHVRVAEDVGGDEGVEVEDGPMWTWAVCGR